jgi:peptide deformylase
VLFTDRMSPTARADVEDDLLVFENEFKSRRETGGMASDEDVAKKLAEWEARYA